MKETHYPVKDSDEGPKTSEEAAEIVPEPKPGPMIASRKRCTYLSITEHCLGVIDPNY